MRSCFLHLQRGTVYGGNPVDIFIQISIYQVNLNVDGDVIIRSQLSGNAKRMARISRIFILQFTHILWDLGGRLSCHDPELGARTSGVKDPLIIDVSMDRINSKIILQTIDHLSS